MRIAIRLKLAGPVGLTLLLAALALASPAFAESPWWHLTSGSRPGNLQTGGTAVDEVQEVQVTATQGDFYLEDTENGKKDELPPPFGAAPPLPYNATGEEVQKVLEGFYGAGDVEVTEGPLGKPTKVEDEPYVIKFTGAKLSDHPVALLSAKSFPFSFDGFSPLVIEMSPGVTGPGAVEARQKTEGAYRNGPELVATVANLGDANVSGETDPVKITDKLPAGLKALFVEGISGGALGSDGAVECVLESKAQGEAASVVCTFTGLVEDEGVAQEIGLPPFDQIELRIGVALEGATSGELNEVSVSGGETPGASIRRPITVSDAPTPSGVEAYESTLEEVGGAPDTQAGSHPFQFTTTLALNQDASPNPIEGKPVSLTKDLSFRLPTGLVGNPTPFTQCTLAQFFTEACPQSSVIGVAMLTVEEPGTYRGIVTFTVPVFNMEPSIGEPARFGFLVTKASPVFIDTSVRTGGDYGITVTVHNITQTIAFLGNKVTIWGVPGAAAHNKQRDDGCLYEARGKSTGEVCSPVVESKPPPFLSLPTSCTGPLQASVEGDSWEEPGVDFASFPASEQQSLDGCGRLPFSSSISAVPDGQQASTPSGLKVDVHVPQEANLNAEGLAGSDVKDIKVTLPEGVTLNPSGANGLEACSEPQIGFTGEGSSGMDLFTAGLPSPFCPDGSKVATVKITTPLLPNPLVGSVYLASQNANPFGSLVAMYIVAEDPVSGTLVKLPGEVSLNPTTGQITATFLNNPQLPFEDAELHFFGGERAPLSTPSHCGTYTTQASFTPWSGGEPVNSTSSFDITSGPNGAPCPGAALPFAPSLTAGTVNNQAGSFSAFTMTMGREDGQQNLKSIQLHMPPGLSGILTGVPLCGEAQANAGTCSAASLIGETTVSVGLGGDPYTVTGGQVFLTGGYKGAPFGLSIVNPAVAGPFNLGKIIVRARIEVNPLTAALTVTSDESGPYAIPPSIDGIPLQIKHVNVTINRAGFTFNPTNCGASAITGALDSIEGASQTLSVPFQATNCATLKFAPKFSVSTSGKTSKADGASLTAKLSYPAAAQGTQANIARVKVDLPKQLPSRLTTLQKACTNKQFELNPANCPSASKIGYAKVTTPLLPVPLEGPAIFVSHGGEAFPSLTMVLQGYGVTVDLVGTTFISHAGITSTTFKSVPDVPFSSFELTLSQGPYSALAANLPAKDKGSFCGQTLSMPTAFVAQNGTEIHESTAISVTGCAKAKSLTRAQKLTKALKACKKKGNKAKRTACETTAHKDYAPLKKAKKKGAKK